MVVIFSLLIFNWIALRTSQSLMDLSDLILIVASLVTAYRSHDFKSLWTSYRHPKLLAIWFLVISLGYLTGFSAEWPSIIKGLLEFRWMFSFLGYIYLVKRINWDQSKLQTLNYTFFALTLVDLISYILNTTYPRAAGFFESAMPFAHSLGPLTLSVAFLNLKDFLNSSNTLWKRALSLTIPILGFSLVILSLTRGVWIGMALGGLFGLAFLGRKVLITTLLAALIGVGLVFNFSSRVRSRTLGKTTAETESNRERLYFWKCNFEMFKERPLFGVGYSINNLYLPEYMERQNFHWPFKSHAHNQYIQFLSGTGLAGLLMYLLFLTTLLLQPIKTLFSTMGIQRWDVHRLFLLGCTSGLICFIVGSLTESNFGIAKNRFMFLFVAALNLGFESLVREKNKIET